MVKQNPNIFIWKKWYKNLVCSKFEALKTKSLVWIFHFGGKQIYLSNFSPSVRSLKKTAIKWMNSLIVCDTKSISWYFVINIWCECTKKLLIITKINHCTKIIFQHKNILYVFHCCMLIFKVAYYVLCQLFVEGGGQPKYDYVHVKAI